jgi:AcrR family transcriptional regulator
VSIQERRERERADRHQLIVQSARELAENEGWDAVTTRRLAERIEYSQPVLYSHFANKDAIVEAVALEGFAELAEAMNSSRAATKNPRDAFAAVTRAYVAFAEANPALYLAMFTMSTELPFARPDAPASLKAGFGEIQSALAPLAGDRDAGTFTEVGWSALHGLITLDRAGRLSVGDQEKRLEMLVDLLVR